LKGDYCNVNSGIVHYVAETIAAFSPLQVAKVYRASYLMP